MSSPPCPPRLQKSTSWGRAALKFSRKINSISPVWGLSKLPSNGMTASVPGWSSGSCRGRLHLVSTLKPGRGRGCPCPRWVLSRALLWHSSGHAPPCGVRSQQCQGKSLGISFETAFPIPVTLKAFAGMVTNLLPAHASLSRGPVLPRAVYAIKCAS